MILGIGCILILIYSIVSLIKGSYEFLSNSIKNVTRIKKIERTSIVVTITNKRIQKGRINYSLMPSSLVSPDTYLVGVGYKDKNYTLINQKLFKGSNVGDKVPATLIEFKSSDDKIVKYKIKIK